MGQLEIFEFLPNKQQLVEEMLAVTRRTVVGWHYCLDYSFVLENFDPAKHHRILDIGSGPFGNPLHDYIEIKYGKQVFAINRETPADSAPRNPLKKLHEALRRKGLPEFEIDWVGNLLDFSEGGWDLILAISALEHNEPSQTMACWKHAQSLLREGGLFIGTFAIATDEKTKWNDGTKGWDLSIEDAQKYWDCEYSGNLAQSLQSYDNPFLRTEYKQRFGKEWLSVPDYIAAGTLKYG